ncbi:extracellular solute-binding protein [Cellulomonas sp. Marseille-Q8402]
MRSSRTTAIALSGALSFTLLAACSSGSDDDSGDSESGGKTVLRVVSLLPGSEKEAFDAFDEQVAQFEEANPDIDVQPEEYEWKATTFAAQLAGGTLPTVFEIPFTDGKTLIENGQLADIDAQFSELPYAGDFNPNVLDAGTGADGKVYAIPAKSVYGIGLHYNRALFAQAGLDPDDPPTTWDEVRADAKAIADATGQAGYATMTQDNTGGWQLTVATYARGGRVQEVADDGTVTATLDNDGTKEALEYLHDLRWEDGSMGANFLLDWSSINQAFAAGQVGMYTSGSDVYTSLVQTNAINPDDYGLTAVPLEGDDAGVLGGGTLAAVSTSADEAQKDAAVKWIDFYYLRKLTEQDAAVQDAETLIASDQPVGTPVLPIFSQEQYAQSQEWIADLINVPLDQMTGFTDVIFDQPLVPEPSASTQELYGALDTVVQAVLTDESADIDALLETADANVQAILDKNAG